MRGKISGLLVTLSCAAAAAVPASSHAAALPSDEKITAMTYNVKIADQPSTSTKVWSQRRPAVVDLVNGEAPAVVALEEVSRTLPAPGADMATDLAGDLGANNGKPWNLTHFSAYDPSTASQLPSTEVVMLLYRSDRFTEISSRIESFPDYHQAGDGCHAAGKRTYSWMRLKSLRTGLPYLVVGTHLSSGGACRQVRQQQATYLMAQMARLRTVVLSDGTKRILPVLLMGDMNVDHAAHESTLGTLTSRKAGSPPTKLRLSVARANASPTVNTGWNYKTSDDVPRIDYILASGFLTHTAPATGIIRTRYPLSSSTKTIHVSPSDHYAVWATYQIG